MSLRYTLKRLKSFLNCIFPNLLRYRKPVLDLPSTKFIFGCEGDDLKAVSTLYNFTEAQRELVAAGNRAECLMKAGGRSLKLKVQLPEKRLKQLGLGGN